MIWELTQFDESLLVKIAIFFFSITFFITQLPHSTTYLMKINRIF